MSSNEVLAKSKDHQTAIKLQSKEAASWRLYFHLEFHPHNPASKEIQQLFLECMFHSPGKKQLNDISTGFGYKVPIDTIIIATFQAKNLGDMFSYRDIKHETPASSYL